MDKITRGTIQTKKFTTNNLQTIIRIPFGIEVKKRKGTFNLYTKNILKAISMQMAYPIEDVKYVYDQVFSFDETIWILYKASQMNVSVDEILHDEYYIVKETT